MIVEILYIFFEIKKLRLSNFSDIIKFIEAIKKLVSVIFL